MLRGTKDKNWLRYLFFFSKCGIVECRISVVVPNWLYQTASVSPGAREDIL